MGERMLGAVEAFPPLPAAVTRLLKLTEDPDVALHDVCRVIESDSSLTLRLLRVANSGFLGLSRRISTVSEAVIILGLQAVKNIALGVSIVGLQKEALGGPIAQEAFWRHSLGVACSARMLALRLESQNLEEVFVAGLLHDIGKLVLLANFREDYSRVLERALENEVSLHVLEGQSFGIDHAEVGSELAEVLKLPPEITSAIANHHLPLGEHPAESREALMIAVVQIANNLTKIAHIGESGDTALFVDMPDLDAQTWLSPEYLRQTLLILPEEVRRVEVFLQIQAHDELGHTGEDDNPSVGVWVQSSNVREVVNLTSLAMGFDLVSSQQLSAEAAMPDALVFDETCPNTVINAATDAGALCLSVDRVRRESHATSLCLATLKRLLDQVKDAGVSVD